MRATFLGLVSTSLLLSGCSWSPAEDSWPLPPDSLLELKSPPLQAGSDMKAAQRHAGALLDIIDTKSNERGSFNWATGDYVSLGALMAVGGAMADQTGLMNTGAGLSVLGISASDRYQYKVQHDAYEGARIAINCVITQAGRTNDEEVMWARTQQNVIPLRDAASALSAGVVDATNKIKEGLITRLKGIQSEPAKASDFQRLVDERFKAQEKAAKTEALMQTKIADDGRVMFSQKANPKQPLTADEGAQKALRDKQLALVPLELQPEVAKKLILLLTEVNNCTAGF